jgi:hypothetical protein
MLSLESGLHSHNWTIRTNAFLASNLTLDLEISLLRVRLMLSGTISLLRVGTNSAPINYKKLTTELNGPHFSEFGRLQI